MCVWGGTGAITWSLNLLVTDADITEKVRSNIWDSWARQDEAGRGWATSPSFSGSRVKEPLRKRSREAARLPPH